MSTTQSQLAEYTLVIDGMTCGHCVRTVSAALAEVPGLAVRSVTIGSAEIGAPDGLTVAAAITALDEAGYPAHVREAKPAGESPMKKTCCGSGNRGGARQGCCG